MGHLIKTGTRNMRRKFERSRAISQGDRRTSPTREKSKDEFAVESQVRRSNGKIQSERGHEDKRLQSEFSLGARSHSMRKSQKFIFWGVR